MLVKLIKPLLLVTITLTATLAMTLSIFSQNFLPYTKAVDPTRYQGIWFELARNPAWFERNCAIVWTQYTLIHDNKGQPFISVHNSSFRHDGSFHDIKGKALITDPGCNHRLKVLLGFWPALFNFFTKYNYEIHYVDDDYTLAIVGHGKYLWILVRDPLAIDSEKKQELIKIAHHHGLDTDKLIFTEWSSEMLAKARHKIAH